MEERREIYKGFATLNYEKAATTIEPIAHLQFYDKYKAVTHNQPLIAMNVDEVLEVLNKESILVQKLLHQMKTYEFDRQAIVGLIFVKETVLSDVVRVTK